MQLRTKQKPLLFIYYIYLEYFVSVGNVQLEEISLIIFFLTRENFDKYFKYISKLNLERETKNFLNTLKDYYSEYKEIDKVKVEDLLIYFSVKHPVLKKNAVYQEYLSRLGSIEINEGILKENLNNLLEKYFASEIIYQLTEVLDGTSGKLELVKEKIKEFEDNKFNLSDEADESIFVSSNLESLLDEEVRKAGLKWRLNCLNSDIGELRGGTLGHVFARVDTGKTSFLVSEVSNFASQLKDDEVIVWFNNEEKGTRVQLRIYQAVLNCSKEQLQTYAEDAERTFEDRGGRRIKIYDSAIISIDDIVQVLQKFNVRMVVIDQGDKVKFSGDKDMATHERLKALYGKFRELAKEYGVDILAVGQASAAAENKKWLMLDHMDNSKTGKPGELDYAIGIGKSYEDNNDNVDETRYIHVCKNKMKDGAHGRHRVFLTTATAIYSDRGQTTDGGVERGKESARGDGRSAIAALFASLTGAKPKAAQEIPEGEAGESEARQGGGVADSKAPLQAEQAA